MRNHSRFLSEMSEQAKTWERHKTNSDCIAEYYRQSQFKSYGQRIQHCAEYLRFQIITGELKLSTAQFCRVRHCSICQWRRSLKWKARAYTALPTVVADFPRHRWIFLTLTIKNCSITDLKATLSWMHESFKRLTKLKVWPVEGWIKSTEVTRGQDGLAHPHFHCLLMVPPSYFSGAKYISQKKWGKLWQQCLRSDYEPIVDVRAIKVDQKPSILIPEILKYQTKAQDLTEDQAWLIALTEQLHKTRAVAIGGVLRNYIKSGQRNLEEPEAHGCSEGELQFNWQSEIRKYSLDN